MSSTTTASWSLDGNISVALRPRTLGDTKFQYQPLDATKNEIRLLRIQPAEYSHDIECKISHASLDEKPTFKAISYAWGDPDDTCLMRLYGHEFPITRSLWGALQALRSPTHEVAVWADAACINQSDNIERGLQVQNMTKIYETATETALWLGPEEDDSELGLDILDTLTGMSNDEIKDIVIAGKHKRELTGLVHVFERSYWERLWCVQEVFNSNKIDVYCGHHRAPWETYDRIQESFGSMNSCLREFLPGTSRSYVPLSYALQAEGPWTMALSSTNSNDFILYALTNYRSKSCSDPRDRVYALLGLFKETEGLSFIVNYDISVRKLYTDVVVSLITATRRLDSICAGTPDRRNIFSLPSWVPDWTSGEKRAPLAINVRFSAAGASEAVWSFNHDCRKLQVSAIFLSTIRDVFVRVPEGSHIFHVCLVLATWRADIGRELGFDLATHESFASTMALGELHESTPREWLSQLYHIINYLYIHKRAPVVADSRLSNFDRIPYPQSSATMIDMVDLFELEQLPGRQLAITASRLVCLGTGAMREGDQVCVLVGCSTPVVLRKIRGNEYTFISEVYVDGYMFGRAMDEEREGKVERRSVVLV